MEHEISAITGWVVATLQQVLGNPVPWVTDQMVVSWFIVAVCLVVFPPLSRIFRTYEPGKLQQMLEIGVESVNTMLDSFIGPNGRRYFAVMGGISFFILAANLITFFPGFQPPTSSLNTTVALGVLSFLYYNFIGLRVQGVTYLKHFVGDPWWLFPVMIPIEILSHLSRPLSLSVRLFGNIFGEHTLTGVFFTLLPIGLPVVFAPLGVFVAFMQTFVFVMLSMIYVAGAVEHGH